MDENTLNFLFNDPRGLAILLPLTIWSLIWKGIALWKAARSNQRNWFIAMLIINSFGILEIVYIFYFQARAGKNKNEAKM